MNIRCYTRLFSLPLYLKKYTTCRMCLAQARTEGPPSNVQAEFRLLLVRFQFQVFLHLHDVRGCGALRNACLWFSDSQVRESDSRLLFRLYWCTTESLSRYVHLLEPSSFLPILRCFHISRQCEVQVCAFTLAFFFSTNV